MFTRWRSMSKTLKIKMDDWESVKSKDGKQEWVTLWYREFDDTGKGLDSIDIVNDLLIKDGKISRVDQYTRKLH